MFLLGFFFKAVAWILHYPVGFLVVAGLHGGRHGRASSQAATGQYWRIPVVGAYAERLRM